MHFSFSTATANKIEAQQNMFGQPGNGDLLLGRGGFDGSIGNGFSNETGANGGSVSAPGQSGSSAFDLSDFPSLGGSSGLGVSSGLGGSSGAVGVPGGDNSLANALRQQQQILAQQQMLQSQNNGGKSNSQSNLYRLAMGTSMATSLGSSGSAVNANFNMATEDFPALPGAPPGGNGGNTGSGLLGGVEGGQTGGSTSGISFGTPASSASRTSNAGGVFGGELDGLTNQFDSASLLSSGLGNFGSQSSNNPGLSQQQRHTSSTQSGAPAPSAGNGAPGSGGSALSGDYGLLGLLKIIRLSDADRNALAVGSDLTSLGLNLNSSENLYSTFASPWSESPASREPQYQVSEV